MTKPAWKIELEEWLKTHDDFLGGLDSGMIEPLEEKIATILSSELQAVLGEEKPTMDFSKKLTEGGGFPIPQNIGWNAHREACLKRGRERGIIK